MGGAKPTSTSYDIAISSMQRATNANPYIIYGDFSKCNCFAIYGQYSTGSGYETKGYNVRPNNVVFGTKYQMNVANISGTQTWRNITIYEDRVEFGSGGYSSSTSSAYGLVTKFIIGLDYSS